MAASSEAEGAPSAEGLERGAVPVHLPGLVAHWPAVRLWACDAGLQRLVQLAGSAHVEAMVGPCADGQPLVGDMQHLMLVSTTLAAFLDGSLERQLAERAPPGAPPLRLYLAQSPLAAAGGEPAPLAPLLTDLGDLLPLQRSPLVQLSSVNLWASPRATRSSLHYDPYSNLLCVLRGSKTVRLAPPSVTPHLRPQPPTSASANHSPLDLAAGDAARFATPAAAAEVAAATQLRTLAAGDALFIPEGWWHQVDSGEGTVGVNYWWESGVSRQLGGRMDRFYFRRILQSLVEQQKQAALAALPRCDVLAAAAALRPPPLGEGSSGTQLTEEQGLAARLLALAVDEHQRGVGGDQPSTLVTPVVATLADASPQALLSVLMHLRRQRPAAAEHLLLHSLDDPGWELLSSSIERWQEELAAAGGTPEAAEETVGGACDELYSAVGDRQRLLAAILQRKEAFARQALRQVLETELGGALD